MEKYAKDAAFQSRRKAYVTKKYAKDAAFQSRQKAYVTEKYAKDAAFQSRHKAVMKKYKKERRDSSTVRCASRILRKYRRQPGSHQDTPQPLVREEMREAIGTFQEKIRRGPTYVCTVCHRALFLSQVKQCKRAAYSKNLQLVARCLTGTYVHVCGSACTSPCSVAGERMQEWICFTCDRHLKKGKMASIAAVNNLHLAPIPSELEQLNVLERQLIAKVIPFAKIVALPKGQQRAVHGAVVCVPSEMERAVNCLPRPNAEAQILQVKLKRNIKYKGHQYYYTVSMKNVLAGLAKLKEAHPDYRDVEINEGAVFDIGQHQPAEDPEKDDVATEQQPAHIGEEHQALRPGLVLDTCMQPPDIAQDVLSYGAGVFSIAPAQRNQPVGFFSVPRLEAQAFPVQFPTGQNTLDEARQVRLYPGMYFNSRLFSVDTRFARDANYLFFCQFVTETYMATNSMAIQMRKSKKKTQDGRNITSEMLRDQKELEKLLHNREATRFMQPLRGTPAYWEKSLRDLRAMVRQLGKPTFFLTFSAAEMRWPEVIEVIKAQQGERGDFSGLDWTAKCDILRSNPVTVMRLFEKRVDALLTDLILSPAQPIGPVEDYFYRVEFQARGSPHIHMLVWVKDAPESGAESGENVLEFIDRYISCQLPDQKTDPELHKIVSEVQMHSRKHSKSCTKGKVECRFGFPKLPMRSTRITFPLGEDERERNVDEPVEKTSRRKSRKMLSRRQKEAKDRLKSLRDLLKDEKTSFGDLSELLVACNMTEKEYVDCVDALSSGMAIVMKRDLKDCWVNAYNPDLLRAWDANMDIQYVLDEYSCIEYMMSYLTKPEHEMTEILNSVVDCAKKSDLSQKEEMKVIMQAYSKHREVSAQESVARTCSLPLKKCSRNVVFIQTDEDGVKMSVPMSKLMNMRADDQDVWMAGLPEKYANRPRKLESMCLAEFASQCRVVYGDQAAGSNAVPLLNDAGHIQERSAGKPAVIRFARFSETKNPEKHYRQLLKLYLPHRKDAELKSSDHPTYREFYHGGLSTEKRQYVDFNRKRYEGLGKKIDKIMEQLQVQGPTVNAWNSFAPEIEVDRLECLAERGPIDREEADERDAVPDYQVGDSTRALPMMQAPKLSPDTVRSMLRSMNETQASLFYAVRDWCLRRVWGQNPDPFFYFLTGGAGCGKSHVIKCVHQEATKVLRQLPRFRDVGDMSLPTVLLTAFTGTAAFNISGKTLHSILRLPKSLKPPYKGLGNSLDEVRALLANTEILIIDEVSMISKELLAYVDFRFRQIKGDTRLFGGLSVLAVGDFYQLPPVGRARPLCVYEEGVLDVWKDNFQLVSLTDIMRQKDDKAFAELLNRLRIKRKADSLSDADKTLLSRVVAEAKDCPTDALHIFATNKQVGLHNAAVVASLRTEIIDVWANDFRKDTKTGVRLLLSSCVSGKSRDLPDKIQVGLGVRVMLVRNLDVEDGLVNGTFGTIEDVVTDAEPGRKTVKLIGLKLDSPTAGLKKRAPGNPESLVYIERLEEQTSVKGVVRLQFPMKVAFGCTAHKVQGMTMTHAVVSLKRIFEPGMAYVALSRTTSLEGLKIVDFDEKKIYADETIRAAMETMPQASFLNTRPLLHFVKSDHPGATLTIVHHNVEGLLCHIDDIKCHHELGLTDVLCLTETHLFGSMVSPKCQLEGYRLFARNRHVSYSGRVDMASKDGGGVATYCRSHLRAEERRYIQGVTDLEFTVVKVETPISVVCATVYRPPNYDLGTFLHNMESLLDALQSTAVQPVVVCGDFNEDLLSPGKKAIRDLFEAKGFTQLVAGATTDKQTLIDHIYISRPESCLQSGILHTYYSYHNPVFCILA